MAAASGACPFQGHASKCSIQTLTLEKTLTVDTHGCFDAFSVEGSQTELGTTSLLAHFVAYVNGANNITRGFPQSPTPFIKSDDRFSADAGSGTQTEGPCDILAAAGNPCVAAHSTTRALFANYSGPLYNLSRPDGTSKSIGVTAPGGFADKAAHDAFCGSEMDCVVFNIFDQSPMKNHLGPRHKLVNASRHPIMAGGREVYGLWFDAVSSPPLLSPSKEFR